MKKVLSLFLLLFGLFCQSQELLPFVENYDKSSYKGDNQVWSVVQGQDKAMYFANNHYLLRYNGVVWEKYLLPNKTIIRSIFSDGDRIYSGSYKEFGYWKRSGGKMFYFSISKGKNIFFENENEEIWKIFKAKNAIYFQSFNQLYVYEKGSIKKITFPYMISYCFLIDGDIFVATVEKGIFKLVKNQLKVIPGWDVLKNSVVHGIQKRDEELFIFTQKRGVFIAKNEKLIPWSHPLNEILKNTTINLAQFVSKDRLIIGSGLRGLFIYDFAKNTFQNINRKNVLLNNSVLSIGIDNEKDLWLGLDNGISHVEINSPVAILNDNSGALGSVYSVVKATTSSYLIASNHGVFEFEQNKLSLLPNTQGQSWNISPVQQGFMIGHNDGTFLYQLSSGLSKLNGVNGGWNLVKSAVDASFLQATYTGILMYPNPNNLKESKIIQKLLKPIKYLAQNRKNEIWAADNYRGLYRIQYDDNFQTQKIENITQQSKIQNDFGVKIFDFKNELLFLINNSWYTYNSLTGLLEINDWFQSNFKNISDVIAIDDKQFLIIRDGILYHILAEGNQFKWNVIQEKYYKGKLINDNLKVYKTGNNYLLNLDDGFISLQFAFKDKTNVIPKIEAFSDQSIVNDGGKIDFNSELKIRVISGIYGVNKPHLFYRIDEVNDFVSLKDGAIVLNNLNSGSHTVTIYNHNGVGFSELSSFSFVVKQPWYFSFWMILLYLLVIGIIFFVYYKWNKLRYIQKLKLQEEALKHQNEILEMELKAQNELQFQEYEKHILELELQTKSSEVAGKSLSIAKQTEMMESIQNILDSESDLNKLKNEIKKVIKINSVNKHEWEAFETNLNQIHKEFVSNLSKRYPNLTPKDIKLCIYLKMNLSSKEIAPMLNISFRGVELHRYRLRKKLQLSQEENLTKFLLTI